MAETTTKARVAKQKARKKEAQKDLKAITEAHAPASAQNEKKDLESAVQKVIDAAKARLTKLRRKLHSKNHYRRKIIDYCQWGVAHEPSIHYAQVRPIPIAHAKDLPLYTDCSGFATLAYHEAGAPDPNGYGYNGQGYTGTILQHCQHILASEAKAGDLVVFGAFPGTHVVVLAENHDYCYSHGQEAGPLYISIADEVAAHRGQTVTYCRAL